VLESLKGDVDEDVVVFTGSGVTGAIYKLANVLMRSVGKAYKPETTVVFISLYEHNSNIYIWKELGCKVVVVAEADEDGVGGVDLTQLEKLLQFYASTAMKQRYNLLIGSFTAASNVSGILADVDAVTALMHKYGALCFWDYATAGPYVDVNMTNKQNPMLSKDAVFISPHKYLGGPGCPGLLCAKRALFQNYVPVVPGGGTVFFAFGDKDGEWEYLQNIEEREEGGTPDIIGSIRCALTLMIKDHLSVDFIESREKAYLNYFLEQCGSLENLSIIGKTTCDRLPVISFLISHTRTDKVTKYLHHNFIAALMNDLFGIQGRGGCACAGMYGLHELDLDDDAVNHVLNQMRDKNELARPGYFRINLHYTLTSDELHYVVKAVKYMCANAWKFLPLYDIDPVTGNYVHRALVDNSDALKKQLRTLLDISFDDGTMQWQKKHQRIDSDALSSSLNEYFEIADDILSAINDRLPNITELKRDRERINDTRPWYWLPSDLFEDLKNTEL
jgi:selenocysteine lyase/cysteine desulfurase